MNIPQQNIRSAFKDSLSKLTEIDTRTQVHPPYKHRP